MGLNKSQEIGLSQMAFDFVDAPEKTLRALQAKPNEEAKKVGFALFYNMRVTENSVIFKSFQDGIGYSEAVENLTLWKGRKDFPVKVKVKNNGDTLDVLIIPA